MDRVIFTGAGPQFSVRRKGAGAIRCPRSPNPADLLAGVNLTNADEWIFSPRNQRLSVGGKRNDGNSPTADAATLPAGCDIPQANAFARSTRGDDLATRRKRDDGDIEIVMPELDRANASQCAR